MGADNFQWQETDQRQKDCLSVISGEMLKAMWGTLQLRRADEKVKGLGTKLNFIKKPVLLLIMVSVIV